MRSLMLMYCSSMSFARTPMPSTSTFDRVPGLEEHGWVAKATRPMASR